MPFFFATAVEGRVAIEGADARHLVRSLRARPGERIDVVDPAGFLMRVRLDVVGAEVVEGVVESSEPHQPEPRLRLTVGLAMLPAAGLESALARCTELGAARFVLVDAARSVARGAKPARWAAICREASMLAGRLVVPTVTGPVSLDTAVASAPRVVVLDRRADGRLAALDLGPEALVLIGPEGGWTEQELASVPERASLGLRNLRADNAAAAAVVVALVGSGDV
jgi:16S rRNA (uracil1498-N3)-methyltransferase